VSFGDVSTTLRLRKRNSSAGTYCMLHRATKHYHGVH
jgi:hypothetical protein